MHTPDRSEVAIKHGRVRSLLQSSGYDAVVLGRQDNFAWFTGGGTNRVVINWETGFGLLLITAGQIRLVAQTMDCDRIMEEELGGLDIEPVRLRWYERSREQTAALLLEGKRMLADIAVPGATCDPGAIYKMHYPLTDKEIQKCRELGQRSESIIAGAASEIRPGMSEHDVESMLFYEYAKQNMTIEVLLVGSDERVFRYRHPNPSPKKIERFLLIHPAVQWKGLHANITRMVYFGDTIPADTQRRYDAVCTIEAAAVSLSVAGNRFSDIFCEQKRIFRECGFEDEWRNHFQGGITGYLLADPTLCNDPEAQVSVNQAFDWFITITGVKSEELSITTKKGPEVVSAAGNWPLKEYCYNGRPIPLPEILQK
jgi:Xaa-Pro dipeptidase